MRDGLHRSRYRRPRCPLDGKVPMSEKHARLIEGRDPSVQAYVCEAGYYHVGHRRVTQ